MGDPRSSHFSRRAAYASLGPKGMDSVEFQMRDTLQPASEPCVSGSVSAWENHRTRPVVMGGFAFLGLCGSKSHSWQARAPLPVPASPGLRASAGNEGVGDPRQM